MPIPKRMQTYLNEYILFYKNLKNAKKQCGHRDKKLDELSKDLVISTRTALNMVGSAKEICIIYMLYQNYL